MFVTCSHLVSHERASQSGREELNLHTLVKKGSKSGEAVNEGVAGGVGCSFHFCLKADDRPAVCLFCEFVALLLSSLLNIYSYMHNSQSSQKTVSADYMEIAVHCSDTG